MSKRLLPAIALVALFAVTTSTAHAAGPFEKAGLTADAGRKLSDKEADQVRGGFRGGRMEETLAILLPGVDTSSLTRQEIHQQLQSLGRSEIHARLEAAGIQRPTMGGMPPAPPGGFTPPAGFKPPEGLSPPPGFDASKVGQRAGIRASSYARLVARQAASYLV